MTLHGFLQGEDSVVPFPSCVLWSHAHTDARKVLAYRDPPLDLGIFFLLFVCLKQGLTLARASLKLEVPCPTLPSAVSSLMAPF